MKLIVISSSTSIDNEAEIITRLFELGLPSFHLRNHKISTRKMRNFINQIPKKYHHKIVVHSHFNLARQMKLQGIHLTKSHKSKRLQLWLTIKILKFFNPSLCISTSYTSVSQVYDYNKRKEDKYDFVFLSPVFDTFSNKFQSGFTENQLREMNSKSELPIIARGGIDADTLVKAKDIGFKGIALYSILWKKKEPIQEFKKIIARFKELDIPIE
jgi:thiamine-phosphate pyrophosphorylase